MESRSEMRGQVEVATVIHEGREFAAVGSGVVGTNVAGYVTRLPGGRARMSRWSGETMLECRFVTVADYKDGAFAGYFALPRGRFVAGYGLGDGMIFRGEIGRGSEANARDETAEQVECWDRKDREAEEEDVEIDCPDCGETLDIDCDGMPRCGNCDGPCPGCDDGGGYPGDDI